MKKILLSLLFITPVAASAQMPTPIAPEPGSKGLLPEVPTLPTLAEGRFTGLELMYADASRSYYGIVGDRWYYHAWLTFPRATEKFADAEYYSIDRRVVGETSWSPVYGSDNKLEQFTSTFADLVIANDTDFRLTVHGGEHDGFVSNVVSVKCPTMLTQWRGTSPSIGNTFQLVGQPEGGYSVHVENYKGDDMTSILSEQGYFRYQWYRRNPNTYDLTLIEGANDSIYTPTLADVGYELMAEITGDEEHCSFTYRSYPGYFSVCVPIQSSVSYYGPDGFVLNTDYVMANPADDIVSNAEWDQTKGAVALGATEREPGIYAVKQPMDAWSYTTLQHRNPAYRFVVHYMVQWQEDEDPHLWIREHQLMPDRYRVPLTVKAEYAGRPVPTTIDVLGEDIDGQIVVKQSARLVDGQTDGVTIDNGLYSLGEGYYVVARQTGSTAETFYPSALTMDEATRVVPAYDEDYNALAITIAVRDITESGLQAVSSDASASNRYYTLDGRQGRVHGLNIVRSDDGTVHKVFVK